MFVSSSVSVSFSLWKFSNSLTKVGSGLTFSYVYGMKHKERNEFCFGWIDVKPVW